MQQERFEAHYAGQWKELEELLERLEHRRASDRFVDFPARYREACHHLALARERQYGPRLVDRLHTLVQRGHALLYQAPPTPWGRLWNFAAADFPRLVRAEARLVALAFLLFFGPGFVVVAVVEADPELPYRVLGEEGAAAIAEMYEPDAERVGRPREAGVDTLMFGFYIRNNIGVAFRTFASGIFCGLGSAFFLIYNGVFMGAAAGHINQLGYGETFYPFVIGHGSFELTAIAIAGAAGIRLGLAIIRPGRRSRRRALRESSSRAVRLVYGAAGMLVVAALVEAFWSPNGAIPDGVKYSVGSLLWLTVLAYFLLAGGRHAD